MSEKGNELEICKDSRNNKYIDYGRIFSIGFLDNGNLWIEENCDNYFKEELTKDEAVNLFEKTLNFIKGVDTRTPQELEPSSTEKLDKIVYRAVVTASTMDDYDAIIDLYKDAVNEIKVLGVPKEPTTPCPNCTETTKECACFRNKCAICGNPVGNITFSVCDDCWENKEPTKQPIDEIRIRIDEQENHVIYCSVKDVMQSKFNLRGFAEYLNDHRLDRIKQLEAISSNFSQGGQA